MPSATTQHKKYCAESIRKTHCQCLVLTVFCALANVQGRPSTDTTESIRTRSHPSPPTTPHLPPQGRKPASRALSLSKEGAGTGTWSGGGQSHTRRAGEGAAALQGHDPCTQDTQHGGSPAEQETAYIQGH